MGAGLDGIIFDDLEWPGYQGHGILTSRMSQTVHFRDKVTKEH